MKRRHAKRSNRFRKHAHKSPAQTTSFSNTPSSSSTIHSSLPATMQLSDLPNELLLSILKFLIGSHRILYRNTLSSVHEMRALCAVHPSLRAQISNFFESFLHEDYLSASDLQSFFRFLNAPFLHVHSTETSDEHALLHALAQHASRLRLCSLSIPFRPHSDAQVTDVSTVLNACVNSLRLLHLDFMCCHAQQTADLAAHSIASSLEKLECLSLHGVHALSHVALLSLLSGTGVALRHLELGDLCHATITDTTLASIADSFRHRPGGALEAFSVGELPHCTRSGLRALIDALAPDLRRLGCFRTRAPCLTYHDLSELARLCVNIEDIDIGPHLVNVDAHLKALSPLRHQLRSIRFHNVDDIACTLLNEDLRALEETRLCKTCPNLRALHLLTNFDDKWFNSICEQIGVQLHILEFEGFTKSTTLNAVAHCTNLKELALGKPLGFYGYCPADNDEDPALVGPTCTAMRNMLSEIGAGLKRFLWRASLYVHDDLGEELHPKLLGPDFLTGACIAHSLAEHCPLLQLAFVMRLASELKVDSDVYCRPFRLLERKIPSVTVLLDTAVPRWIDSWYRD